VLHFISLIEAMKVKYYFDKLGKYELQKLVARIA